MEISSEIKSTIRRALDEDIGPGDATSEAILPEQAGMQALLIDREGEFTEDDGPRITRLEEVFDHLS